MNRLDEDFEYAIQELEFVLEDIKELHEEIRWEDDEEQRQRLIERLYELQRRNQSIIRDLLLSLQ